MLIIKMLCGELKNVPTKIHLWRKNRKNRGLVAGGKQPPNQPTGLGKNLDCLLPGDPASDSPQTISALTYENDA